MIIHLEAEDVNILAGQKVSLEELHLGEKSDLLLLDVLVEVAHDER